MLLQTILENHFSQHPELESIIHYSKAGEEISYNDKQYFVYSENDNSFEEDDEMFIIIDEFGHELARYDAFDMQYDKIAAFERAIEHNLIK